MLRRFVQYASRLAQASYYISLPMSGKFGRMEYALASPPLLPWRSVQYAQLLPGTLRLVSLAKIMSSTIEILPSPPIAFWGSSRHTFSCSLIQCIISFVLARDIFSGPCSVILDSVPGIHGVSRRYAPFCSLNSLTIFYDIDQLRDYCRKSGMLPLLHFMFGISRTNDRYQVGIEFCTLRHFDRVWVLHSIFYHWD